MIDYKKKLDEYTKKQINKHIEIRHCARPKCTHLFKVHKQLMKKYCSEKCGEAHYKLLSQIRRRQRDRENTFLSPIEKDMLNNARPLRKVTGVYFLYYKNKLVYIGSSKNIYLRVYSHQKSEFNWDEVKYIKLKVHEMRKFERKYINYFNPPWNKMGVDSFDKKIIRSLKNFEI